GGEDGGPHVSVVLEGGEGVADLGLGPPVDGVDRRTVEQNGGHVIADFDGDVCHGQRPAARTAGSTSVTRATLDALDGSGSAQMPPGITTSLPRPSSTRAERRSMHSEGGPAIPKASITRSSSTADWGEPWVKWRSMS